MYKLFFILFVGLVALFSCKKEIQSGQGHVGEYVLDYGTNLPVPNLPLDNELTHSKVMLGRMLFYEKALSGDNSMACASCHLQKHAFSDTSKFSIGIDGLPGGRQAMAIVNLAWNSNGFFWDGRSATLREQSLKPIQDVLEMHETLPNVVAKLSSMQMYSNMFKTAFNSYEITPEKISLALEAFMFTLVSKDSKYDRYLEGSLQLSASEERGRVLFFAEYNPGFPNLSGADCAHCHSGSNFENDQFMNNGLDVEADISDNGYMTVSNNSGDKGKFKVPTLRNIAVTFPYMHDGRFQTLEEVVDHYNADIRTSSTVDPAVLNTQSTGLMLTSQDKIDLVNFLKTLTDNTFLTNPKHASPF